jgi:hypothetical protein
MPYEFGEEGPKPRNDAYTGLLAISFFAMLAACLLLLVDWYGYEGQENPAKKVLKALPPVKPVPVAGAPAKDGGEAVKPAPKPAPKPPEGKGEMKPDDKGKGEMKPKMEEKGKMDAKDKAENKDEK